MMCILFVHKTKIDSKLQIQISKKRKRKKNNKKKRSGVPIEGTSETI